MIIERIGEIPMLDPKSNRIVTATPPGGPEALCIEERPCPSPGEHEVLIKNTACGVNRPDQFERRGFYPAPPGAPQGLGLEISGIIAVIGSGVSGFQPGDEVCALVAGGGYSDYAIADHGSVMRRPSNISLRDAAGLPEAVFTVWVNLFEAGSLSRNETVLIHGGTSGIGTMAIQMAKAAGARVIATAGTTTKCELCRELGADHAINYREHDFEVEVKALGGVDVVLDMVGGDYVKKNINIAKPQGRIVSIAFLQGSKIELDLMPVMLKRLVLTGSTLRARPVAEKARIAAAVTDTVWPWIEAGLVKPIIDSQFALADVRSAHQVLDAGGHSGKILLTP
jgi:NADPH2:quinone reductase